ncbi:hypothetical protein ACFCV3_10535 [Kribbella sp. NPDC056345]|uniref:hypothetical protein n=1 Tax=Kribbella sp. NPDC056345 TaxID=3345789 RepID=UPI0035DCC561
MRFGATREAVLRAGAIHELPLVVDALITGVPQLETSTDDGKSWRPAPVRADGDNRYIATIGTPDGATSVSLRSRLTDASGNEFETTIIRAYRLAR